MIPNTHNALYPGDTVKLNRFDEEEWTVGCGWYSCNGNRPTNGWYLVSKKLAGKIKPLNQSDLDDIYLIEPCGRIDGKPCDKNTSIADSLRSICGFDGTKTQILMNENGFIHWTT